MINISASIIITILKYLSKLYKTFLSFARSEVDVDYYLYNVHCICTIRGKNFVNSSVNTDKDTIEQKISILVLRTKEYNM